MARVIRIQGNSYLREHPFLDPFNNPAPGGNENFNCFIYPGDELVLWHKLTLPDDVSAASIGDISFKSGKVSIIAKKPQVYSEEYSAAYKSTRVFELDSFVTTFNNSNANQQLWGTDGYAPNIHLQQDRSFKLPSGDFRRQVKFFTDHTPSTSSWDYWFYFPILFRWEYWSSLLGVNDDFFNLSEPQEGRNNWWYHYFIANKWQIDSRLELSVLIQGEPVIIRCDLNLTPARGGVNDYSSNTDYINKNIKTSAIAGTPSNSPALIYGNQDTEIIASFEKNSLWAIGEKNNISAVLWIEPYEGSGVTARTRGSSLYQITPESVFKGLNTSLTDDDSLNITGGSSQYAIFDPNGKGALVFFDNATGKITVFGMLDYSKLSLIYPGVTKFTIYARLYNSSLLGGVSIYKYQTIQGEELKQNCLLVSPPSSNSLCEKRQPDCPFTMNVFADLTDKDDLKNDKSDFLAYGGAEIKDIIFVLAKMKNCNVPRNNFIHVKGDFSDDFDDSFDNRDLIFPQSNPLPAFETFLPGGISYTTTLDNCVCNNIALLDSLGSQFGKYFPFGKSHDFLNNDFIDDYNKKYTGALLEWRKVLDQYGDGVYQVFIIKIDVFNNVTVTCDERVFCLRPYHCNFADRTVRIEVLNEGLRGSLFDPLNYIDYAGGWNSQYRLGGLLQYKTSPYVKEFNQYGDSDFNKFRPIIIEQQPKLTLAIRPIPGWMDFILSTNVLQGDEIRITDYNINNRHKFIKFPVMNDGDFTPADNGAINPLADVEINLAYGLNSLRKRNSQ